MEDVNKKKKKERKWTRIIFFIIVVFFISLSFFAPKILTIESGCFPNFDSDATANIGSTIGGLMTPFISIAIVIVTWLAFNEQFEANERFKKNFELQKFENQFYQMLRLHKENVNEIEMSAIKGGDVKGRNAFFHMNEELCTLCSLYPEKKMDKKDFEIIYKVFFWGIENRDIILENPEKNENEISIYISALQNYIEEKKIKNPLFYSATYDKSNLTISYLKGHYQYLGHYYRHLFHMVKFVANQDEKLISELRKLDYLRMVRAQLSNYEQIMLFYNWLSGYGSDWEYVEDANKKQKKEKNYFFTKYRMIHNLWYDKLYKNDFIEDRIKWLKDKGCSFEIDE